jgi:hypothetical protein
VPNEETVAVPVTLLTLFIISVELAGLQGIMHLRIFNMLRFYVQ